MSPCIWRMHRNKIAGHADEFFGVNIFDAHVWNVLTKFYLGEKFCYMDCFNVWNQCCLIWTVDLTSVADEFKFRRMFYDNVRFQGIFTLFRMIAEETAEFNINFIKGDKLWYLKWLCSESMALEFSRKVWIAALVLDHCIFVCVSWQTAFTYDVSKIEMNSSVVPH